MFKGEPLCAAPLFSISGSCGLFLCKCQKLFFRLTVMVFLRPGQQPPVQRAHSPDIAGNQEGIRQHPGRGVGKACSCKAQNRNKENSNSGPGNHLKKAGKHDIILFSKWTLSHDLVGRDVVGDHSFREYIKEYFGAKE